MMNVLSVPAQAAGNPMTPTEALSILAQARTLDARCGFLKGSAHEELAGYAARAEIVTAERLGARAAESAVNRGTEAGRKAACNSEGKALVRDALAAAREAVRHAGKAMPERHAAARRSSPAARPAERDVRLLPARKAMEERVVVLIDRNRSGNFRPVARISSHHGEPRTIVVISGKGGKKARTPDAETRYVAMTSEYYRLLRCGTADRRALMRLYDKVRRAHYGLLRTAGPDVTARAKARARVLAARKGCGVRMVRR